MGTSVLIRETVEEVTTFTDSDWAGCKETRKSSSAGVVMLGEHALKAYTRKQKIIARSSAEAELYAAALGASESKGIVSLLRDLGYEKKPVLAIDAKATEHILHRQGIGKLKHIDVAYLWIQDEIRSHRLRVRRVRSEDNVADLGTKPLSLALGYVNKSWRCSGTSVQQSARSSRQQVTMSREQPAENRSNRKHPQHSRQRQQVGQELVLWMPTNLLRHGPDEKELRQV